MNIAKKINASANCRYGDPPVTVKKKVPSSVRAPPFVWFVTRRSYGQVSDKHRKAIHVAAGEFSEGQWVHGVRVSDRSTLGPSSCLYSPECVEVEFSEVHIYGVLRSSFTSRAAAAARAALTPQAVLSGED